MASQYQSPIARKTPLIFGVMAACLVLQGIWHSNIIYPKWRQTYAPVAQVASGLSPDQFLISLAGFRELVAGILWVRADSFFDQGNYDAILPIIRLVTILDPKQIDVYATGMWHIGYNFTDEDSRSDRRYIPSALALGKEGSKNNSYTYELFFETGWLWYHKIDDNYENAVKWFEQATERKDMLEARRNLLSMAYQRDGQVEKQLEYMEGLYQKASEVFKEQPDNFQARQNKETIEGNLDNHLIRMVQRGYYANKRGEFTQGAYDTRPPFDVGFSARVSVIEPKVLRVQGTWNVRPVGTRVRFIVRDADYPGATPGGMTWDSSSDVALDPPKGVTFLQDQLFVRDMRFNRDIDMSRDPTMYPFGKDEYVIEFYYNPRSAPAHMQDKFGYSGEGMTDKHHLNTEVREGQRVIFATMKITKDQLLRQGEWDAEGGKTPVLQTAGYRERTTSDIRGDIIKVPTVRPVETAPQQ